MKASQSSWIVDIPPASVTSVQACFMLPVFDHWPLGLLFNPYPSLAASERSGIVLPESLCDHAGIISSVVPTRCGGCPDVLSSGSSSVFCNLFFYLNFPPRCGAIFSLSKFSKLWFYFILNANSEVCRNAYVPTWFPHGCCLPLPVLPAES